ncbi:hypothetical protein K443DRAFT_13926 [Laccaria amethystina LaAM-08-1]|uniref:Uncharacterized protein n=1 Tax=Laccaria amethystina LaAM-08-1 TaxID=1095629 RepID=A0A0C9X310_9AGAR|nr:hypothetical protein K443DRAFT_13926 [Laccaria amethystina LaAM-08-1]
MPARRLQALPRSFSLLSVKPLSTPKVDTSVMRFTPASWFIRLVSADPDSTLDSPGFAVSNVTWCIDLRVMVEAGVTSPQL